jgi:hypothetical protein
MKGWHILGDAGTETTRNGWFIRRASSAWCVMYMYCGRCGGVFFVARDNTFPLQFSVQGVGRLLRRFDERAKQRPLSRRSGQLRTEQTRLQTANQ